jgi:phage-related protein
MVRRFEIEFLEQAEVFLRTMDKEAKAKIIFNIERAQALNDPRFFKKLDSNLWEFRAEWKNLQYRIIAFWYRNEENKIVVCTHGFIKKTDKVPSKELYKAKQIMLNYLNQQK